MSLSLIPRMEKMKKQKMMTTNTIKKWQRQEIRKAMRLDAHVLSLPTIQLDEYPQLVPCCRDRDRPSFLWRISKGYRRSSSGNSRSQGLKAGWGIVFSKNLPTEEANLLLQVPSSSFGSQDYSTQADIQLEMLPLGMRAAKLENQLTLST